MACINRFSSVVKNFLDQFQITLLMPSTFYETSSERVFNSKQWQAPSEASNESLMLTPNEIDRQVVEIT